MYIQVTTRCNMLCAHCLYACTAKGKDMSSEVFRQAIDIAADEDDTVAIGGGEPTLHPDILWFLGYATLVMPTEYRPFMVTNGAMDVALWQRLLAAFKRGNIDLHVSKDPWHDLDMIPEEVWDDADEHKLWWGEPECTIGGQAPTRTIVTRGRAASKAAQKRLEEESLDAGYRDVRFEEVDCLDARVAPDGNVYVDASGKAIKVGPLSEDTYWRAKEIVSEIENEEYDG